MLFCAFVDYSKAFDLVDRLSLWTKLLQFGITGKLFRVVQNIYKSIKSCVMINGISSLYFNYFVGVRQGENLSPLLFALFLNDIESFCSSKQRSTLKYIDKLYARCNIDNIILHLFLLLYADDTIVTAESETGLQTNLDLLKAYCDLNQLSVNISKTKVMVFTRSKSRLRNLANFKFGELYLERVDE